MRALWSVVDHFYPSIPGFCDYADYYRDLVATLPDGAHVVEVGVWQGQSTAALGVEIANSGKAIRLDVVDHFAGSPDEGSDGATPLPDLRARFEAHVAPIRHVIRDIHAESSTAAATRYRDGSLDCVWLDGAHDAPSVLADLEAWWPKVKPGGVLAGHDVQWPSVRQALEPWSYLRGIDVSRVSATSWSTRKPVPVATWTVPAGARRCLVVVASNERTIGRHTAESLLTLGWGARVQQAAEAHGFADVQFTWVSRHVRVDDLRNEAVQIAQAAGATHLLFLDADMTWPPDVLTQMLAHHDQGVVSGLYFLKRPPHYPVAFTHGAVNLQTVAVDYTYADRILGATTLQPAALVGMGCTLIPLALCEAMPAPWFEYRQNQQGAWTVTEDVAFCQKAAALGCPIWVDPTVKCGHVGADVVTEAQCYRARVEERMMAAYQARQAEQREAVVA